MADEWQMNDGGFWKGKSLCGRNMRGVWREGSFNGDPEGYAK
jgi:hypothetical protein